MALMISALCRTTALSVTVLPMVLEVARLFGGYFLAPSRLPKYFSWLDALSYIKYSFVGAALNELQGLVLTICPSNSTTNSTMINGTTISTTTINATNSTSDCLVSGQYYISQKGYDYISVGGCIAVLITFIIVCRVVAFLGVRFLKH